MNTVSEPGSGEFELPGVLTALNDPVRRSIVGALARCGEVQCGTFSVNVTRSTLAHHLRGAGITPKRRHSAARN